VAGWTEPEGSRPYLGALLLAYYDPHGRLIYAGRVGTGIDNAELGRLWRRLQPLATDRMPLDVPLRLAPGAQPRPLGAARAGRRGEVPDLDRGQSAAPFVYEGLREDKPAKEVRRPVTHPKPAAASSATALLETAAGVIIRASPGGASTRYASRGVVSGRGPAEAPKYPVVWCCTTDLKAPFGERLASVRKPA
jgi:hypothetical protein